LVPRYLVQRTFPEGLAREVSCEGAKACLAVVENNAEESVTWITTYVSSDTRHTFCVCDGPNPQSIERAALANGLPVDSISEVRVLDPYSYLGVGS
jgi:Nickel responsive protein SCO4226-like